MFYINSPDKMVHVRQTAIFVIIWSVLTSDVTFAAELDEEWNLFVKTYHKVYDNQLHEQQRWVSI